MKLTLVFWIVTALMVVIALSFLVFPVVFRQRKASKTVWLAAIAVPSLSIALYAALGTPAATNYALADEHEKQSEAGKEAHRTDASRTLNGAGSVASLVVGLEERMRADPGDGKGWLLLSKSYFHLGRSDEAVAAYAKARELGQVEAAFESKLGGISDDKQVAVENEAPVIRGRLTIADSAKDRLDPDDSIFVFAKSTDGSALPVAAMRKSAKDLPFDFELSDKQAMSATSNLSSVSTVTIIARASKTGNAMRAEPGLEVASQQIEVGNSVFIELQLGE